MRWLQFGFWSVPTICKARGTVTLTERTGIGLVSFTVTRKFSLSYEYTLDGVIATGDSE